MHFADSLNAVNLAACSQSLLWRKNHHGNIVDKATPFRRDIGQRGEERGEGTHNGGRGTLVTGGALGALDSFPFFPAVREVLYRMMMELPLPLPPSHTPTSQCVSLLLLFLRDRRQTYVRHNMQLTSAYTYVTCTPLQCFHTIHMCMYLLHKYTTLHSPAHLHIGVHKRTRQKARERVHTVSYYGNMRITLHIIIPAQVVYWTFFSTGDKI